MILTLGLCISSLPEGFVSNRSCSHCGIESLICDASFHTEWRWVCHSERKDSLWLRAGPSRAYLVFQRCLVTNNYSSNRLVKDIDDVDDLWNWLTEWYPFIAIIGAFIGALAVNGVQFILPWALAFAAGAMIYVVIREMLPEAMSLGEVDIATIGFLSGFILLMSLDGMIAPLLFCYGSPTPLTRVYCFTITVIFDGWEKTSNNQTL